VSEADQPGDPDSLRQAASVIRDLVDDNDGALEQSANELFATFGFWPTSHAEQLRIEGALRDVGLRVEPADAEGKTVRISSTEPPHLLAGSSRRRPLP
jgi:hypothetical protein